MESTATPSTVPVTSKDRLEAFIKSTVAGTVSEQFLEVRKSNEAMSQDLHAQIAAMRERNVRTQTEKTKGLVMARLIRCVAFGRNDLAKAAEYAKSNQMGEEVVKALATQPNSSGGYIVPPGYSADMIDLLYPRVAVRALGAVSMPMPNGTLTIPKLAAGITAQYIGENEGQNAQQPGFGVIGLAWKKLRATVPLSNDLIRFSSPRADDVVKNDMTSSFAVGEDQAFLRGPGSGQAPKGLDNWILDGTGGTLDHSVAASSADGSDLTLVIQDLYTLPRLLEEQNIPFVSPGWVFSPRTKFFLMTLRDSAGKFYLMDEMKGGTLLGWKFVSTTQMPSNTGVGNDESSIIFGDFNDALIGEVDELIVDVSTEASYLVNNQLVSAFDLDQTVIRGISRHDFAVRRQESFAKLTGIKWGKTA